MGDVPLSLAAKTQRGSKVPAELAVEEVQQSLPAGSRTPADMKRTGSGSGKQPKSSLKLEEQRLKARLLDQADDCQQTQLPVQVRGAVGRQWSLWCYSFRVDVVQRP